MGHPRTEALFPPAPRSFGRYLAEFHKIIGNATRVP